MMFSVGNKKAIKAVFDKRLRAIKETEAEKQIALREELAFSEARIKTLKEEIALLEAEKIKLEENVARLKGE